MRKVRNNAAFFLFGGVGYGIIELIWRGRTHWSMLVAGGICFVLFSKIAARFKEFSVISKAALCAVVVTAVELVFGIIFNMILKMNVWDYSHVPLNFLGQICPLYTVIWGILGMFFIPIAEIMNKKLQI